MDKEVKSGSMIKRAREKLTNYWSNTKSSQRLEHTLLLRRTQQNKGDIEGKKRCLMEPGPGGHRRKWVQGHRTKGLPGRGGGQLE